MNDFIPVSTPDVAGGNEQSYTDDCLRTGWISSEGAYVRKFEQAWADYCSMAEGIAVSSGTAALEVALRCLPLESGDEVIMPSFTIISCANAVIEAGAKPVLVDCVEDTWAIDTSAIEEKITARTRAIMVVHIYGHPVDMDPVAAIAKKHGLFVIEDAAEAHGALYRGKPCGGLADISIFSFYANKIITTGEGGMVLTNSPEFAERARSLRNLCFTPERRFLHAEMGHVYRMTNIQAAIGLAQVERLETFVDKKRDIARIYGELLGDITDVQLPVERSWAKNVYWMYGIVLGDSHRLDADGAMGELRTRNIDSRAFFLGMHEQPALWGRGLFKGETYPITERIARRGFYIPSGLLLNAAQQETVAGALRDFLGAQ
jgi:perosamine synthetase